MASTGAKSTTQILAKLRNLMKKGSGYVPDTIEAYIVTSQDAHESEYLAATDKRREFVSGFTGSAGTAIVTSSKALLWTDGRYHLQAESELDENWTLMKDGLKSTLTQKEWLAKNLPSGSKVGVDPYLISFNEYKAFESDLSGDGIEILPVQSNLVDLVWGEEKPAPSCSLIAPLALKYTGKSIEKKLEEVREKMKEKHASILVLTALDEVAYLLNLRGGDIEYNPVFFSYLVLTLNSIHLFIDDSRITSNIRNHFNSENCPVAVHSYEKILPFIRKLISNLEKTEKVWISEYSNYALISLVPKNSLITSITPVNLMKAVKNPVEVQGMINCHIRDAAALICYLAWLEKEVLAGKRVTEISGAQKLADYRKQQEDFAGLSFDTISSSGPNAAIIHYSPKESTDRQITTEEIYLVDSGGQYKDGTTDVTRTLHFGTPSEFEKECFTRVFKGAASLAMAIFPEKIRGNTLDVIARQNLWDVGLDYLHGTGHGIGSYLNVHEGPMGITYVQKPTDPGLEAGMFLSDEPGYYENGKFGIRIENIVQIVPAKTKYSTKAKNFLTFKTITLVPIQTKLLNSSMLTAKEINFLNEYHTECRETVGVLLKQQGQQGAYEWLIRETQPIG